MRAISAPRSQRISTICLAEPGPARSTRTRSRLLSGGAEDVAERLRQVGVVDRLDASLRREVVGAEERGDLGGVGRAARVLEQERVEERGAVFDLQPDLVGEAHADQARPHGVARRLALGDVERVRERRQDLGQPQVAAFVHVECIGVRRARPIPRK